MGIIPFWSRLKFEFDYIGFFASAVDTIGMAFVLNAYTLGPAGPISAMGFYTTNVLTIINSILN